MKALSTLRSLLYSSSFLVISDRMLPIALRRYPNAMHESTMQNDVKASSISERGVEPTFFMTVNAQYYAKRYVYHQDPPMMILESFAQVNSSPRVLFSKRRIVFHKQATRWERSIIYMMSLKSWKKCCLLSI